MNILNCDVSNCANNNNHCCVLNKINVEGPGACIPEQTCCSSFTVKTSKLNSIGVPAREETSVRCRAENCKYNRRGKCTADDVSVVNLANSPVVMAQTECKTFKAR